MGMIGSSTSKPVGKPLRLVLLALLIALMASPAAAAAKKRTPDAHRPTFREFLESVWPKAAEFGVSRGTFEAAAAGAAFDRKVVAVATQQPEFVRPVWQYIESAVSDGRIERGREKAREAGLWLDKAEKDYGVDKSVVMGVWGVETDFGRFAGANSVISALASLAYSGFRTDYFTNELICALIILEEGEVPADKMRGSWAGAMGQTQFMPSNYLVFAVDFEGKGRRDIWSSEADAIGSTANYLAGHGWKAGLPWGMEVMLPAGFALADADSSQNAAFKDFAGRGVKRADGRPLPENGEGRLLIPAGLKGPIFLITDNFDVIKSYNPSTTYALSVALLGEAIVSGARVSALWPRNDGALSAAQVRKLQGKLKRMGYDVGMVDGMVGDSMRSALRAYQTKNGMVPDGYPTLALFRRVEEEKPASPAPAEARRK